MTDKQLQEEILAELEFEPEVRPERIGVGVDHGVVSLTGHVESYAEKLAAERAARRVYSAKAVVDGLEVHLPARDEIEDAEIARAGVRAMANRFTVPPDSVRLTVRYGHVTMNGTVDWDLQRKAAEEAVRHLRGVRGVTNLLRVRNPASPAVIHQNIEEALRHSAEMDARGVTVVVDEGTVTLRGIVRSMADREEAEAAVWRGPGVSFVENQLVVVP